MISINHLTKDMVFEKIVLVTSEQVEAFALATGDRNPIHFDDEQAKKFGFRARVAHGQMVIAMANPLLTEAVDGIVLHALSIVLVRPVLVGDEVIIRARMVNMEEVRRGTEITWSVEFLARGKKCFDLAARTFLPNAK